MLIWTVRAMGWIPTRSSLVVFFSSGDCRTHGAGWTREVNRGKRSVERAYQAPSSVVLRNVVTLSRGFAVFRKKGLGG